MAKKKVAADKKKPQHAIGETLSETWTAETPREVTVAERLWIERHNELQLRFDGYRQGVKEALEASRLTIKLT